MTSKDGAESGDSIFVLDELVLRPGMLAPFRAALESQYMPGAQQRGMRLLHTWVTPPVELEMDGTQVVLVWQLDGVAGFWTMRSQSNSPEIAEWWRSCEPFVVSRTRRFAVEANALPRLEAAARVNT